MGPVVVREARKVRLAPQTTAEAFADHLAVEEPLEIRIGRRAYAVTLRTPGDDEALAAGFLLAEGIVRSRADITFIRNPKGNTVAVALAAAAARRAAGRSRPGLVTSACGACGRTSIERLGFTASTIESGVTVPAAAMRDAAAGLRGRQPGFALTGGMHAAGVFAADGTLRVLKEDVGRHNAVDKAVGALLLAGGLPLRDAFLVVSGRAGFEIVQKAVMAGLPVVAAVSAPTSLAVETARAFGVTLAGFLRDGGMNVYTHPGRIRL